MNENYCCCDAIVSLADTLSKLHEHECECCDEDLACCKKAILHVVEAMKCELECMTKCHANECCKTE